MGGLITPRRPRKGECMFGLGAGEIAIAAVAALIVFGPKKLPELARAVGKSITEFKKGTQEVADSVKREIDAGAAVDASAASAGSAAQTDAAAPKKDQPPEASSPDAR